MGMLRVMSRRGDDCVAWDQALAEEHDPEALAAIREAERIFHRECARGATAFKVETSKPIERLEQFDQTAEQIVIIPRVVGGNLLAQTEANAWDTVQALTQERPCLHQLFEAQAARTPAAVAAAYEDCRMTYQELNERANQLAHYLCSLGVGPETLVGLYVQRSLEMIVGLLGILKAGGAYVPLDPTAPAERLAFLLQDSQPAVLVTQQQLHANLPTGHLLVVCLDTDQPHLIQQPGDNLPTTATPDNLAYVIYTSGSTGRPKGVMVTHHNVIRLFASTDTWYGFHAGDVWTLFHSVAFDFSVWELWGALLYGGRVVIVPHEISRTPAAFYGLLIRERVTVLNQTPSAFYQLMEFEESGQAGGSLSLRLVIFGGEALDFSRLQRWFACHGERQASSLNCTAHQA